MANFNLKAIISVVDRASGPMRGINRAIGGMAKRFGDIGTAGGSLASAFGVQQIAQSAIDFESTMADVKKVVDFDTPEGFAQMKDDILAMSKTLPMAANGIGQIVAAAGQSGIAREELATFAEDAAKMGIAFDLSADEAGDMMAKWRVAFGMTQDQVRTLADQVNYLGNTGPAKAAQISDVIRRVGALGDIGGVQAKYVAALGASIAGVGVESEVAATATKSFILSMVAGEAATKGQKKAFAALGIDTVKLSKAMQKDATGAFTKVLAAIEKLPKDRQATIMQEIFGKESLGAIAPLLKNLPNLRENIAKVSDATRYGGSMNKEYEARAATTANAIQLMANRWEALKITLGDALLPTLNELMGPLGGLIDQMAAFAKANPELTKYALLMVAVAGAVGVAGAAITLLGGAVMSTLGSVLRLVWGLGVLAVRIAIAPAVLALRGALLAARGAMMAFNLAMAANPIGAVVAAVAALAGAAYLLYDNWGPAAATAWTGVARSSPAARPVAALLQVASYTAPAPTYARATPARQQQAANSTALAALIRQSALVHAAEVSAAAEWPVHQEVIAARDELAARIDAETLRPDVPDDTFRALTDLRVAVVQDLTARSAGAARLATVTPTVVQPSVVLAYDLYEDAARGDDIVARNRVAHPGFVPPEPLKVLT
ncbi:phage tail tape measure protein (plasmid) [Azospirillum argentinense]|uniref:Phage tail tape measure protein n=1 Tax=Azospirillum argentinense TaxID=2970906 RepID=A0A2K1FR02_9PROT|nr:phage tail tape measure protein [Azospirillum argentinense]PNQ94967.1 phage tail tape measure protein [Azospirillum argentinense]